MANIGMREVLFEGTNPTNVDIVFVHGLNGDRLATWTKDKICWPRDLLKDDIPSSRIMSWGYDANVMNFLDVAGQSSVAALALQLLEDLARRRRTAEEMQRPIIFVVHSLGGLVVKDALTQSYNESRAERVLKPKIASIKSKTLGVIFAGTPHRGADKAKWGKIATNIATIVLKDNNSALVGALCRGSETLERLQNDFARVIDSLRIYTFFEDYRYPKIGKIVDNDSASLAAAHEHKQVLPGNHSDMIKFSRKDDSGYERVSGAILDILEAGPMESQRQEKNRRRNIYGIASQSYHGESELHITFFEKGAVIRNIKFVTREVWRGTFNGKTGLFPKDYIDIIDDDSFSPISSPIVRATSVLQPWKRASVIPKVSSPPVDAGIRVNAISPLVDPVDNLTANLHAAPLLAQNPQYRDWLEAFWIACEEGHLAQVDKQMARGVDINTTAVAGDCISQYGTGLNAAVHNNHEGVVKHLLTHGARPNQPGNPNSACLPLHIAASLGYKKMVKILLNNGANIHVQGGTYRFALTAAAVGGDTNVMRLLIDQGAVLKAQDMEKETALHGAVVGGHLHAVKWLIEQGLDPDIRGDEGTALELAIKREKEYPGFGADIIRYLSGGTIDPSLPQPQKAEKPSLTIDPNANGAEEVIDPQFQAIIQDLLRASLLLSAMEGKYEDVMQLMAPPDPVNPNEQCRDDEQYGFPLHAAAANGHWKVALVLLENGANVNAHGLTLGTPLHFAVCYGHVTVAMILLAWGAEVNSVSNIETLQMTPLEVAAGMGQLACMELLLRCGAGINLTGGTAGSPLHAAASSPNSLQATQLLLSHGANVMVVNSLGLSPADVARSSENHQTKELLKQRGCPRAKYFSAQRLLAWSLSVNVRAQQQQQVQREKAMQDLIQQYAAAMISEQAA